MPKKNETNVSHAEELRAENEVKKLKLEIQHGAEFIISPSEIPPDIEGAFLDNVLAFEKQFAERTQISLFEYVGKPNFLSADNLTIDKLKEESIRLVELLEENGIVVNVLAEYPDKMQLIYRFITEELFVELIDNMRLPGWTLNFIYEEFHPNHVYDIERRCNDFIAYIFRQEYPGAERFDEFVFESSDLILNENSPHKKKLSATLTHFFEAFPQRALLKFKLDTPEHDETIAFVNFEVDYNATTELKETLHFKGNGKFVLECDHAWWVIKKVDMPGLALE